MKAGFDISNGIEGSQAVMAVTSLRDEGTAAASGEVHILTWVGGAKCKRMSVTSWKF
jgi:hypothetical protein